MSTPETKSHQGLVDVQTEVAVLPPVPPLFPRSCASTEARRLMIKVGSGGHCKHSGEMTCVGEPKD